MCRIHQAKNHRASLPETTSNRFEEVPRIEESQFSVLGNNELVCFGVNDHRSAQRHEQSLSELRARRQSVIQYEPRSCVHSLLGSLRWIVLHVVLLHWWKLRIHRKSESRQWNIFSYLKWPIWSFSYRPSGNHQQCWKTNVQLQPGARPAECDSAMPVHEIQRSLRQVRLAGRKWKATLLRPESHWTEKANAVDVSIESGQTEEQQRSRKQTCRRQIFLRWPRANRFNLEQAGRLYRGVDNVHRCGNTR